MTGAAKTFEEAHERHEHAKDGPTWVPLVAAILAVLAAVSGYVANVRATQALIAKNDAIQYTTQAADKWNEFESKSIKRHIYEALLANGTARDPAALKDVAAREKTESDPIMDDARKLEEEAGSANERSERFLGSHETIEIATTLFEVSIVLISLTALVGSRLLPTVSGIASAIGLVIFLVGFAR